MPGIIGIIGPGNPAERMSELHRMIGRMMHEPFYLNGEHCDPLLNAWIGWIAHKGSFAAGMPLWNEKRDVALIFSGEEFLDSDRIISLRAKGHDIAEDGANYLVHLYEESGDSFIEKLNGRFSGILLDFRRQRVILFNDRYGLGRLYYFENGGSFYFASEAKALLDVIPEVRALDQRGLGERLALGCVLQNRTLFKNISLVPSGSLWVFNPGAATIKKAYFHPHILEDREPLKEQEYYQELRETWIRILPRYFRGPEQIAVSLTGGKDSRMIMAWANPEPGSLPCYSFGGMYRDCQDVKLARQVARICRQSHSVIPVGKAFFREFPYLASKAVYLSDGSMDVSGASEIYVNRLARDIAPIRLTGNYGQEILQSSIAFRPSPLRAQILQKEISDHLEAASLTYNEEINVHPLSFVAFKQAPWHHFSRLSLELSQLTPRSPYLDNDLLALAYRSPAEPRELARIQLRLIAEGSPALGELPTDRGVVLKPAFPITAAKKMFQQFTTKTEYAYDYGMPHWLAKMDRAMQPLHPEKLFLGRHKFVHYRIWYRDELSGFVRDVLLDPRTLKRPYINPQVVERIVAAHIEGTGNFTSEIHLLLTIELIHRHFIDL